MWVHYSTHVYPELSDVELYNNIIIVMKWLSLGTGDDSLRYVLHNSHRHGYYDYPVITNNHVLPTQTQLSTV